MADVGGKRVYLPAIFVKSQCEVLTVLDPEISVEPALQIGCFSFKSIPEIVVFPNFARQPGAAHFGVVGVSLQLACRARETGDSSVPVGDGVPGVLPALVLEPGLLVAALV